MKKILLLTFLLASPVLACDQMLGKYGQAKTVNFCLWTTDATVGAVTVNNAACADTGSADDSDAQIMKDEGAPTDTTNCFTDEGNCYSIALTATEMQAARVSLLVEDRTATKVWADKCVVIETYGHASAEHAFDLDTATQNVNAVSASDGAFEGRDFAPDGVTTSESTRTIGLASGQVDADDQFTEGFTLFLYNSNGPVGSACIIDSANTGDTVTLMEDLSAVHTVGDSYIIKPDASCLAYHKTTQNASEKAIFRADGTNKLCESDTTDDGTTYTRGLCTTPD